MPCVFVGFMLVSPEEVGLQVTFEELQGWLSSYEGDNAFQTSGEA